jgi:membrane-associated protein
LGGFLWIFSFIPLGYFFGNLPVVKQNFKMVIVGIIVISVIPGLIEFYKAKRHST